MGVLYVKKKNFDLYGVGGGVIYSLILTYQKKGRMGMGGIVTPIPPFENQKVSVWRKLGWVSR